MKTNAQQFKRLLPALQHLARFPGANGDYICRKHGCNKDEVLSAIRDMAGVLSLWDEESLAARAKDFGVKVPPFNPNGGGTAAAAVAEPPAAPVANEPAVETAAAPKIRNVRTKKVDIPASRAGKGRTGDYHKVCRLLLDDPDMSESAACAEIGLKTGSWAYFKKKTFGLGSIDRGQLQRLVNGAGVSPVGIAAPMVRAPKPKKVLSEPVPAEGWKELNLNVGRAVGFLARYSPGQGGLMSLTMQLRADAEKAGKPIVRGQRMMMRWHPGLQQLIIEPGAERGLLIQGGTDKALMLRGKVLADLLGDKVLLFTKHLAPPSPHSLLLAVEGGAA